MAGLVAVLGSSNHLSAELDALASAYRSLRSESQVARLAAGARGVVSVLAGELDPPCTIERAESDWSVHVGTVHAEHSPLAAMPSELDGQFAMLRYRAGDQRLEVLTDPFGLQALYFARRGELSYLSTSVLALAKHLGAKPSRLGLLVFLRSGPHFGELTNWEGIRRIAPGSRVSFARDGSPRQEVYWRPTVDQGVANLGLPQATQHCVEVAVETLAARYHGASGAWCDITGGFDTRLLALLLRKAGVELITNTVGPEGSRDVVLGRRVADAGGWPWLRGDGFQIDPDACTQAVLDAVAWGDGQMDALQLAGVLAGHRGRAARGTTLFSGGGGGVWRDYAWQQEGPLGGRTRRVNLARWVAARFLHAIDISAFRSDPTPPVRDALIECCRAYVAPYEEELNSAQLDMLLAYKCVGHDGAYQTAARGVLSAELPYFAKQIFETPFSVAPRVRNFHRLMRHAIWLLDPRVAALPTTSGGPAEPLRLANGARFAPYWVNRGRGVARKLTQNLPGPTIGALPRAVDARELAARTGLIDDLRKRTDLDPSRLRTGPLYANDGLRAFAGSPSAAARGWPLLGRVITAELSLEAVGACLD